MIHLFKESENIKITVFLSKTKLLCLLRYDNRIKRTVKKFNESEYNKILKLHLDNGFKIIE